MKSLRVALLLTISLGFAAIGSGVANAQAAPTISYISPTSVSVGATVYVYGTGFDNATVVAIDAPYGQSVNPVAVAQGGASLSFVLPANVGIGTHSVQVEEKASNLPLSNSVTLTVVAPQQAPTLSYIAPTSVNPGATVYVYGANYDNATVVAIDAPYGQSVNPTLVAQGGASLSFVLPTNVGVGTHSVQVEEKASSFPLSTAASLTVTAVQQPPVISSIRPTSVNPGATINVYGANFDNATVVAIDAPYGQAVNPISLAQGGGSLSFVLPANVGIGSHSIQVEEKASDLPLSNSVTLTVTAAQSNGPSVTVLSPNGGETLTAGSPYTITWTTSNFGNLGIELDLVDANGYVAKNIALNVPNTGSYVWTPSLVGSYKLLISSQDKGPSAQAYSNNYFTIAGNVASAPPTPAPVNLGNGNTSPTNEALLSKIKELQTLLVSLLQQLMQLLSQQKTQ